MAQRLLDLFISTLALLVLAIPFLFIAILVKLFSPGPVFFRQRRVGRHGRIFHLFKFRTMTPNNEGPQITVEGDRRISGIGRFLRRWKIDELPQFFNVFIGDMSIIGPRPEVERYVNQYTPEQREVLQQRPGLAGMAQLMYAHESELLRECDDPEDAYVRYIMPRKISADIEYGRRRNFWTDIGLMGEIALSILGKKKRLDRSLQIPSSAQGCRT